MQKIVTILALGCLFVLSLGAAQAGAGVYEDMVYVPAGEFTMGSDRGDSNARPEHRVFVKDFFIDRFEVTNDKYAAFLNRSGNPLVDGAHYLFVDSPDCRIKSVKGRFVVEEGFEDHPVTMVTFDGAVAYAAWAGKRLPTEAEWEKAARGGLEGKEFPWGDDIDTLSANYARKRMGTTPVGMFAPNAFGLYDVSGNVAEMVSDFYDKAYYRSSPASDPGGPAMGQTHAARGGSWLSDAPGVTVSARDAGTLPYITLPNVGCRCARDAR